MSTRNILITIAILILPIFTQAQNHQYVPDSASLIIENYLNKLNHKHVKQDSILYIESIVVNNSNPKDTMFIKRWFGSREQNRVEIWHDKKLEDAFHSDGNRIYKNYARTYRQWQHISAETYIQKVRGYDYRGPLYFWRTDGVEVQYKGEWLFEGQPTYRVYIEDPHRFYRFYFFEKNSGLLFFIDETESASPDLATIAEHVDWRAIHEYTPLGECLFTSEESYQDKYGRTIIHHKYRYVPYNAAIFSEDNP